MHSQVDYYPSNLDRYMLFPTEIKAILSFKPMAINQVVHYKHGSYRVVSTDKVRIKYYTMSKGISIQRGNDLVNSKDKSKRFIHTLGFSCFLDFMSCYFMKPEFAESYGYIDVYYNQFQEFDFFNSIK